MPALVAVTVCCPWLFGSVVVLYLADLECDRLHHLTEQSVRKYHSGHAVLIGFVECSAHEVCHLLNGGRREYKYLEVAVAQRPGSLPVVALGGLNAAESGTSAHYVYDNAWQVGARHVGNALALKGDSRR